MKKEELNMHNLVEVEQTGCQNLTLGTVKQKAASPFGPALVPVLPSSEEPPSEREDIFKNDGQDLVEKDGEHLGKCCTKKQQMMSKSENAFAEPIVSNSTGAPSQACISTDDLLDCLVHPQVTKIVAQLLVQGRSL